MAVITTLGFAGRTEEALAFYRDALDAKTVFLMRFRDCPDQSHTKPGMEDLIFHATFQIDGSDFMAEARRDFETHASVLAFRILIDFSPRSMESRVIKHHARDHVGWLGLAHTTSRRSLLHRWARDRPW
jgi:uncharacterized glyoxalase superfamily protein PhnB